MNEFKDMLIYLRKRAGMTQQDLAEILGLSKSMISMYERGERRPSYETLEAIADFFNVDMNFLLGHDQRMLSPMLHQEKSEFSGFFLFVCIFRVH